MATTKLTAEKRDAASEKGRKLRREGFVPAVLYGHRDETQNIKLNQNEIRNLVAHHGSKAKLDIQTDSGTYPVFIKDLQRDVLTSGILSVDFQILYQDELIKIEVPISFHNSTSVTEFILHEDMTSIEIEALPMNLPERITVDVEGITPDTPIKIKDLEIFNDPNIKMLTDPDANIASAHYKRELEVEADTEVEEPEVIGEETEDEEEE